MPLASKRRTATPRSRSRVSITVNCPSQAQTRSSRGCGYGHTASAPPGATCRAAVGAQSFADSLRRPSGVDTISGACRDMPASCYTEPARATCFSNPTAVDPPASPTAVPPGPSPKGSVVRSFRRPRPAYPPPQLAGRCPDALAARLRPVRRGQQHLRAIMGIAQRAERRALGCRIRCERTRRADEARRAAVHLELYLGDCG